MHVLVSYWGELGSLSEVRELHTDRDFDYGFRFDNVAAMRTLACSLPHLEVTSGMT